VTAPAVRSIVLAASLFIAFVTVLRAQVPWFPMGPFGGDVRSFAVDPRSPQHLYMGTATGWIYDSRDGGSTWKRVSQIAQRDDLVIDHIVLDAKEPLRMLVGAFTDEPNRAGGLWISDDGGATWSAQAEMHGQSIRAFARSTSNPDELVAGTLRGVFRSLDDGLHWKQISPEGSTEIHEVESIAIDPVDPNVIYAGTWHLPWKTTDGGKHWVNIKEGIIDDSDVFSIIIDPKHPKIVYASACSGIYKSSTGAEPNPRDEGKRFNKINGIPSTARRTRKLTQDPVHLDTVYAGTTEGLYRTLDAGEHWSRLTGPELIVNDVYVDPANPDHVLLATDRAGVLVSDNAGESFRTANTGFSARQVASYAVDPGNPAHLFVGVVNDKETGGVFASRDGGARWQQQSAGLAGRDVFSMAATPSGSVLAGTNHGIFRLQDDVWTDTGELHGGAGSRAVAVRAVARASAKGRQAQTKPPMSGVAASRTSGLPHFDGRVHTLVANARAVYAGTASGLLRGDAVGSVWSPVASLGLAEVRFVSSQSPLLAAADLKEMKLSTNEGETWKTVPLPKDLTQIAAMSLDDQNTLWVGGREGLFHSGNLGVSWEQVPNLQLTDVDAVYFDPGSNRMLVTTAQSTFVFAVQLPSYKVTYWNTGWKLRFARPVGDHLLAATLYDGMVMQPQMVDSAVGPTMLQGGPAPTSSTATVSTTAAKSAVKP
jgi:photosystem II stability/assembly factor-like uncharacterized protein